jgi:hypothetical protein
VVCDMSRTLGPGNRLERRATPLAQKRPARPRSARSRPALLGVFRSTGAKPNGVRRERHGVAGMWRHGSSSVGRYQPVARSPHEHRACALSSGGPNRGSVRRLVAQGREQHLRLAWANPESDLAGPGVPLRASKGGETTAADARQGSFASDGSVTRGRSE